MDQKTPFRRVLTGLKYAAVVLFGFGVVSLIGVFALVRKIEAELPSVSELKSGYRPAQVTRILAIDGTVLAELFTERRTVVPIDGLPPHVKLAVLAAEDAGFYQHEGLNYFGILRAMLVNLKSGRMRQGGSTITQQVVKNVLLDSEKSLKRKVREALLARRLEQELSKDQILELYLNHIYFGLGRYGIEEAARANFGKPAAKLSIAEAALMAGIVACPESCSARRDLKRATDRRTFVLGQMLEKGFLNPEQFAQAKEEPISLSAMVDTKNELAPEVVTIARRMLHELEPERAPLGGFTITTTIDPKLQAEARKAVLENLMAYDKRRGVVGPLKVPTVKEGAKAPKLSQWDKPFEGEPKYESHKTFVGVVEAAHDAEGTFDVRIGTALGVVKLADYERYNPKKLAASEFAPVGARVRVSLLAAALPAPAGAPESKVPLRLELGPESAMVVLDVRSRNVMALVGNYEAASGGLDRATQSKRQPGSTFKPIVYSYALHSRRFTPASLLDINPQQFGTYKPSNYEGWTAKDPLRLREVLAQSVNIGAVRVLDDVGPANVVSWAQALGIESHLGADLSLALGSYEVEPYELCGAYATFAAGGMYEQPKLITRIVGPDGKDVELPKPPPPRRVLEDAEAYLISNMMTSVVDHGTATRAKALGRPVAGKTGTSNQSKDTWFAGFTTDLVGVVWVGYDDGKPLGSSEAGGGTALPAWVAFMKEAHKGRPVSDFPRPPGVVNVVVDKLTGKLPYPDDADTLDEVFLAGTEPTETAEVPAADAGAAAVDASHEADAGSDLAAPSSGHELRPGEL